MLQALGFVCAVGFVGLWLFFAGLGNAGETAAKGKWVKKKNGTSPTTHGCQK